MFTQEEIQKIKEKLPPNGSTELIKKNLEAKGLKTYSASTIRGVLSGHRNNANIVLAAYEVATDWQQKVSNAKNTLNEEGTKN